MNGVKVRVARIFNTYGPRMLPDDGRVVSNFIVQALRGEPLTLYGDGSQTRSFCYVSDLIDGLIRLMNGDHTGRSTLAIPTNSRSESWQSWCGSRSIRSCRWWRNPCRRMTLSSANRRLSSPVSS